MRDSIAIQVDAAANGEPTARSNAIEAWRGGWNVDEHAA